MINNLINQSPYVIQGSSPKLPVVERAMKVVTLKPKKEENKKDETEPAKITEEKKISIAITPENVAEQPVEQPKKKKASKKKAPKESIQM